MSCARCEFSGGTEVPGSVPERPVAAIIGAYPNKDDDKAGRPFSSDTARFLKLALGNHGLTEDDFIFLYALRCAPRGKEVKDGHLNACRNWVDRDLAKLRELPEKLVLVCGKEPMESLLYELDLDGGYTANRGMWIDHKGWSYLITFPPNYVADMAPYRHDSPGQWWCPEGSVPNFWFKDLETFARRVKALKERLDA